MSIAVEETKVITVKDSKGQELRKGYPIMIRIKNQDIVCRFKAIENGYFVTETLDGQHENKYRQGSIDSCERISGVTPYPVEAGKMEVAAEPATNPALAPAT